ncbi:nucleolar pre-ribosomal-associated protein 1-like [Argonauta hians]
MLLKRKADESSGDEIKAKVSKISYPDYTYKDFISDLKTDFFSAISNFIKLASSYPDINYDLVADYCENCNEFKDLFSILYTCSSKPAEVALLLDALRLILIRISDDLNSYMNLGNMIAQKILTLHLDMLEKVLQFRNFSIISGIKFLTTLVVFSESSANIILDRFSFDNEVFIQSMLQRRNKKIVKNKNIDKSMKIKIFGAYEINQLVSLYRWKGPEFWKKMLLKNNKVKGDVNAEDLAIIRVLTHELLLEILSSPQNGIIFSVKSFELSYNNTLKNVLCELLKHPFLQDDLQKELLVNIFQVCPEQIQPFFKKMLIFSNLKETSSFLSFIEFYKKVLEYQSQVLTPFKTVKKFPLERLTEITFSILIPSPSIMQIIEQNLNNHSLYTRHICLEFLFILSKRLLSLSNYCTSGAFLADTKVYSKEEIEEFHSLFITEVKKLIPSSTCIYQCWSKLDKPKPTAEADSTESDSDKVDYLEHVALNMQVLCIYQSLTPYCLTDSTIEGIIDQIKKISAQWKMHKKPVKKEQDSTISDDINLKLQTKIKLYFFKICADIGLQWAKKNDLKQSQLNIILGLLVTIKDPELVIMTKSLVCQLLYKTGFFMGLKNEILIWLDWLVHFEADQVGDTLVQFVSNLFVSYISNPYSYIDQIIHLIAKGPSLVTEVGKDDDKLNSFRLDAVLENFNEDDLMEASCETVTTFTYENDFRLPFSPLIVIAAEQTKDIQSSESSALKDYLRSVLLDLFHVQSDPLTLCYLVLNGNLKDAAWMKKSIVKYIKSYLPQSKNTSVSHDDKEILEFYFKIIKKILNHLFKELSKDVSINPLKEFALSDFELFQTQKTSVADILNQVIDTLSYQKTLVNWFFFYPNQQWLKFNDEVVSFIRNLVTDELVQIFCLLSNTSNKKTQILPEVYSQKIIESLNNLCQQPKKKGIIATDDVFIFKYISNLTDILDFITIQKIITNFVQSQKNSVVHEDSLNITGETLVKLLNHLLTNNKDIDLNMTNVNIIFHLLKKSKLLMGLFTKLLVLKPYYCLVCSAKTFRYFLNEDATNYLNLVKILMKSNPNLEQVFVEWILENDLSKDCLENYLDICICWCQLQDTSPQGDKKLCLKKISKAYRKYLHKWMKQITSNTENSSRNTKCLGLLQELTRLNISGPKHFVTLESFKEVVDNQEVLAIEQLHCILLNVHWLSVEKEQVEAQNTRLEILMKCFVNSVNQNVDDVQSKELEAFLLSSLHKYLKNASQEQYDALKTTWSSFIQSGLRFYFTNSVFLQIVASVLPIVYDHDNESDVSPTLMELHQIVIDHSEFMDVMTEEGSNRKKELLLDIILLIMERERKCYVDEHLNVFFGTYGATLSLGDQKLLKIFSLYEKNGNNLNKFRPYLWGSRFLDRCAVNRGLPDNLKKPGSFIDVLNLISKDKMKNSVVNFPMERKLCPSTILSKDNLKLSTCYDPSFILPVFSYILSPENDLDCHLFIEKKCFNYCIIALSCYDDNLRAAAYHALFHMKEHLIRCTQYHMRDQFLYVLRLLKNSMFKCNARISFIAALYLVKVCEIILNKDHDLYFSIIGTFVMKPMLKLYSVPAFFQMFQSSSNMSYRIKKWMLYLLHDGLQGNTERSIYQKLGVFKIIMSYANSSISDSGIQEVVLEILMAACTERSAVVMVQECGILSWMSYFISNVNPRSELTVLITKLLHKLWYTLLQKNDEKVTLPKPFVQEMKILLLSVLDHFRDKSTNSGMRLFLPLFSSVLEHERKILSQEKRNFNSSQMLSINMNQEHGKDVKGDEDADETSEKVSSQVYSERFDLLTHRDILLVVFQCRQLMQSTYIFQKALDVMKLSGYNCDYLVENLKYTTISKNIVANEDDDVNDVSSKETVESESIGDISVEDQIELTNCLINICLAWRPSSSTMQNAKVLALTIKLVISWLSHEVCQNGTIILLHDVLLWIDETLEKFTDIIPNLLSEDSSLVSVKSLPENILAIYGGIIWKKIVDSSNKIESNVATSIGIIQQSHTLVAKLSKLLTNLQIQHNKSSIQPVNHFPFLDKIVNII